VRKTVLATAIAAALALGATNASAQTKGTTASKADVQALQGQMQTLLQRLDRLEATNSQLQTDNAELKALADRREAEMDYLKSQAKELREEGAVAANEIAKVKGADWAGKIKFKGDFRLRDENIEQDRLVAADTVATTTDAADRNRARIRARFGFDAKVTDNVKASFQLATGSDADPRSTNQTLGGENTKKSIWIDQASIDWRMTDGVNLQLGKVKYPFWRPGQSVFYDGDVNPEGAAVVFERGQLFGSTYAWWLEERYAADPAGQNADTLMLGAQVGLKFPLLGGETRVAAHYYDLGGGEGSNPFYNGNANGNSTVGETIGTTTTQVLAYDYNVVMLSGELGMAVGNYPLSFWADVAQNMASGLDDNDTAYGVGAVFGKASNPKTWEVGLSYQSIEKDALFAQFIDSDFADGVAGADGWVLKAAYAPVRNVTVNGTYLKNQRTICGTGTAPSNRTCGAGIPEYELDYDRWQLDVNYKF
jgi:hypothetical protein